MALAAVSSVTLLAQYPGSKHYPLVDGNTVKFILKADSAKEVRVFGDFLPGVNEYNLGGNAEMTRNAEGEWEYTAKDLASNMYFYYFEVDGVRVLDPHNLKLMWNYTEPYNSFSIEGELNDMLSFSASSKGSLQTWWYDSPQYGAQRRLNVYLPASYSEGKKYPVMYMIPGGGDDEDTWVDMGRLPEIMDHLIEKGMCQEMVIVMVNAMPNQLAAPHVRDLIPGSKTPFELMGTEEGKTGGHFVEDFEKNIIPFVESKFSVKTDRKSRAVCAVSLGGTYLMYMVEHNPELFGSYVLMGTGFMNADESAVDAGLAPLKKAGYDLFYVCAGAKDMALKSAKACMDGLDRLKMPYTYFDSKDGHNWRSWRADLMEVVPMLFK